MLAQVEPQSVPGLQVATQRPEAHSEVPPVQWFPQLPQLRAIVRLISQPFPGLPSQSPQPHTHPQRLVTQAWFTPQAVAQSPQWAALVVRLVSQPFDGLPSQSPRPVLQRQSPAAHSWPGPQRTPQRPQLSASSASVASQPVSVRPSQSWNPVWHWQRPARQP